jgi:hypothetical protein
MSIYSAQTLKIEIADANIPAMFYELQGVFVRNISFLQGALTQGVLAENAWEKRSSITKQSCQINAEFALTNKQAASILQKAAIEGKPIILRVTLPDNSLLTGAFHQTRYELFAEDNAVLSAAFEAVSADVIQHDLAA